MVIAFTAKINKMFPHGVSYCHKAVAGPKPVANCCVPQIYSICV